MNNVYSIRKTILKNISLIIFTYFVCIVIGTYSYINQERIYEAKSLIQFEQANPLGKGINSIQPVFFGSSQIEEQAKIYKSVKNLKQLVNYMNLNILLDGRIIDHENQVYYENISLESSSMASEKLLVEINLKQDGFSFGSQDIKHLYNEPIDIQSYEITIFRTPESDYEDKSLNLTFLNLIDAVKKVENNLSVNPFLVQTFDASLMEIAFRHPDVNFAKKILNNLNDIYLSDSVFQNSTQARASIVFLEKLLVDFSKQLEIDEKKLNNFQEENLFVQENEEASTLFFRLNQLEVRLDELEIQELEFRNKVTEESPFYQNLQEQKDFVNKQIQDVISKVARLPKNQQTFINLLSQVEANRTIVEDLLSKKLEFSILEASTLSDVRIIDEAFNNGKVSPILITSIFIYFVMASAVVGTLLSLRTLLAPIRYPSEIEDLQNVKLIGVIPKFPEDGNRKSDKVARDNLITNLQMLCKNEEKSFLVSGPLSGVGKTTIAKNIAEGFSSLGKKVALVDCDFHRGDLHTIYGLNRAKINKLNAENFDLNDWKINENLYVISRPINSSDSALAFFESSDFLKLIEKVKQDVDYLIVDTPPLLSLSDGLVLTKHIDKIILTARHLLTKPRELEESLSQIKVVTNKEIYAVYNCYERSRFDYGYYEYYGYKYYSSYYSYENDEK